MPSVSFAEDRNVVIEVESRACYSFAEARQIWLSRLELAKLQDRDEQLLKEIMRNRAAAASGDDSTARTLDTSDNDSLSSSLLGDEHDVRGLELRSASASIRRKTRTLRVVQGVLDEQCKQWTQGTSDDEKISQASRALSRSCRRMARVIGKSDEACIPEVMEQKQKAQDEQQPKLKHPIRTLSFPSLRRCTKWAGTKGRSRTKKMETAGIRTFFGNAFRRP